MKQRPFEVTWEQWFRYGPDGDESDFTQKSVTFLTLEDAEQFKADLVSGKYRGLYDMTVNECEVTITQEQDEEEYEGDFKREYADPCERYEQLHREEYEYERDYDEYLDDFDDDDDEEY